MELRLPYPAKIFYDLGDSFITGFSISAVYYFFKGLYTSKRNKKIKGAIKLMTTKAPIIGGNFATWSLLYNSSYYGILSFRKRHDILNPLFASFSAGALSSIRKGTKNMFKSGLSSCMYLGLIESSIFLFQKYNKKKLIEEQNKILQKYKENMQKQGIVFRKINNLI